MANAALEHDAMALTRETELDFGLTIDAGPAFYGRRQGADAAVCWTKVHYRTQNIYSQIWLFHEATEQPEISGWPASGFHTTSDATRIAQTTREAGSSAVSSGTSDEVIPKSGHNVGRSAVDYGYLSGQSAQPGYGSRRRRGTSNP